MNDRVPLYKLKLVRERWALCPSFSPGQPQLAAAFFHRLIGNADREHSAALFLDVHGKPTGASILGIGSLVTTPMPAREVFKAALLANAFSVILSHNHPSNDRTPSRADIRLTHSLVEAGDLLGIGVFDHIVITPSGAFTSMREANLLSVAAIDTGDKVRNCAGLTANFRNLPLAQDPARPTPSIPQTEASPTTDEGTEP
jgi:DNA repair protein RadC